MKSLLKLTFKWTLAAAILFGAAYAVSHSIDVQGVSVDHYTAEKPLFGADEFKYEAPKGDSPEDALSSKINWAILLFSLMMVLVLDYAFDISKYTAIITGRESVN